ncbi:MAG TPA: helix-hairpin-helix domain-containing protein [Smithella sp.]|nr:helix-hairpin-helix domain-containing protein [Smithella sp.]HRS97430.1 helix-hairpin-helix domain-containing protein [Smithella sp.]
MSIGERQVRGVIALSLMMAVAPFFVFLTNRLLPDAAPAMADRYQKSLAVEIAEPSPKAGIYFVAPQTGAREFLKSLRAGNSLSRDFPLQTGMKIILPDPERSDNIVIGEMDAARKLALGLPVNINRASAEDLMMVRGVGEKTAAKILALRARKGKFERMEELTEIPGIKEKKLAELKKYLFCP